MIPTLEAGPTNGSDKRAAAAIPIEAKRPEKWNIDRIMSQIQGESIL